MSKSIEFRNEADLFKIDNRIVESKTQFIRGIKAQQRSNRRKWMELNALANSHLLISLPYQAMLSHVGILVEERRKDFPLPSPPPLSRIFPPLERKVTEVKVNQSRTSFEDTESDQYLKLPDNNSASAHR